MPSCGIRRGLAVDSEHYDVRPDLEQGNDEAFQSCSVADQTVVNLMVISEKLGLRQANKTGSHGESGGNQSSILLRILRSIRPRRCRATSRGVSPPRNSAPASIFLSMA